MASVLSTYLGNKVLRWALGTAMISAPANCYLALFDGDPKGGGSEVTTTIRAGGRLALDFETVADNGTTVTLATDADTDFGTSAGDASVSHVGVFDASSSGNLLASKALSSVQNVQTGAPVKVLSGDLEFNFGNGSFSNYLANKMARWFTGNALPSAPGAIYLALFDGNPKSGGTEETTTVRVAGRVALDFDTVSVGTDNQMVTDADTDFGTSAGDADIDNLAIYDASSSGNQLFVKAMASPQSVLTGAPVKALAGDITVKVGS